VTEGFNRASHIGAISIFLSLLATIALSWFLVNLARLNGLSSEEAAFIIDIGKQSMNLQGILLSGIIIGKMKVESLVEPFVYQNTINGNVELPTMTRKERITYAKDYTLDILKKVWIYIVIGIGIGAWIHGYVPADFLAQYAGSGKWYAVPLAVLIGIPLYSNAAGVIPLVSALTEKGVSMGTTLAFMMSVTALSLPEFMILKKVMKLKLIFIFAGIVAIGIIFTGYLFNFFL
jgi:hypothetical protein